MLNIWLIQIGEPLPLGAGVRRQRLTMLSKALAERGHKVTRWASAFDHLTKRFVTGEDTVDLPDGVTIRFLRGCGYCRNISFRRYLDHAILARDFLKKAGQLEAPDVILGATPPHNVANKVGQYARNRRVPFILDIRDQWPDTFLAGLTEGPLKRLALGLITPETRKVKKALSFADSITAVSGDFLKWGLAYARRERSPNDKVFYIGAEKDDLPAETKNARLSELMDRLQGKTILSFAGSFGRLQNPLIIVEAARRFEGVREDLFFVLVGDGPYMEKARERSRGLSNLALTGWLEREEITYVLDRSSAGICPLNRRMPLFPNKAFMYFSSMLPVIASTPGELHDLIKEKDIGLYYEPNDLEGLCGAIECFAGDPSLSERMQSNLRGCFDELFDAGKIYVDFAGHLEEVAGRGKSL